MHADKACIYTRFKQHDATGKIISEVQKYVHVFLSTQRLEKPAGSEFAAVSAAFVVAAVTAVSAQGQMTLTFHPEQCLGGELHVI